MLEFVHDDIFFYFIVYLCISCQLLASWHISRVLRQPSKTHEFSPYKLKRGDSITCDFCTDCQKSHVSVFDAATLQKSCQGR